MERRKKMLVYDGTLLANMYSTKNSDRTGVYFTVYNIFLQLVKNDTFEMLIYCEGWAEKAVRQALADMNYPGIPVVTLETMDLTQIDLFFAAFAPPPDCVACSANIAKYMILYDVTPLALPDIEAPNQDWFARLEKSLNGNDHYFCISEYTKKDFLRFYPAIDPDKTAITYLAASENFYFCKDGYRINQIKKKYGIPQNKPYIFSLCTLQPRKNLIHAVKCFVKFVQEEKAEDLIFVLGGGHWDIFMEELERAVPDWGIYQKHIIGTGYIDDKDLAPLLSGAMCIVHVSLYEGFGLPVLEAMQCGCPVIASNTTSLPEVVGDAGILVDPRDPVALREAYRTYYQNHLFRKEAREKGLVQASYFSWKNCVQQMTNIMESTCGQTVKGQLLCGERKKRARKIKDRRPLFGKVWTEQLTTLYCLGLPVARKVKGAEQHTIRIFGIPILKEKFRYYEVVTYVGFVPVKRRLNYLYLEEQVNLYMGSFDHALYQLNHRINHLLQEKVVGHGTELPLEQRLDNVRAYQLIQTVEKGHMTLRDELLQVNRMMHNT